MNSWTASLLQIELPWAERQGGQLAWTTKDGDVHYLDAFQTCDGTMRQVENSFRLAYAHNSVKSQIYPCIFHILLSLGSTDISCPNLMFSVIYMDWKLVLHLPFSPILFCKTPQNFLIFRKGEAIDFIFALVPWPSSRRKTNGLQILSRSNWRSAWYKPSFFLTQTIYWYDRYAAFGFSVVQWRR